MQYFIFSELIIMFQTFILLIYYLLSRHVIRATVCLYHNLGISSVLFDTKRPSASHVINLLAYFRFQRRWELHYSGLLHRE